MSGISSKAAGSLTNKYKYNGKELQSAEFSDGSGLEWYDYVTRKYDNQTGRWMTVDPLAAKYPIWSPYVAMADNPIRNIDPTGKEFINFDKDGNYLNSTKDNWWHNLWHGHKGRILDDKGKAIQKFSFADTKNDVADIKAGIIKKIEFVKEEDISKMMAKAGVFNPDNKIESSGDRYSYIKKEGKGGGKFDFSYTGIPQMYPGASKDPLNSPSSMIFLVDDVAHNHMNFGNFLYGAAGSGLGLSLPELLAGAHFNSVRNSSTNGYKRQLDSMDDQYSIMKGFDYGYDNYYKERSYYGTVEVGEITPWFPISIF
jgi:RHS repeat-associated protein